MNVLAHQNLSRLNISGKILINGKEIGKRIKSVSAYVQQEDLFIGTLTVREHLMFQVCRDSTFALQHGRRKSHTVGGGGARVWRASRKHMQNRSASAKGHLSYSYCCAFCANYHPF